MNRREFLALAGGAAFALPVAGQAQHSTFPVIGYLDSTSPGARAPIVGALRLGLKEAGYVEDRNLTIEYRWAEDHNDRLGALAADLVSRRVDVIVASAIRATLAAKAATAEIPIVFATANDPVRFGLVAGLNRPGGNLTGISWLAAALGEKRLGVLHELMPPAKIIGVIVNPNNANAQRNVTNAQDAANALGAQSIVAKVTTGDDFESAISFLVQQRVEAALVLNDPLFNDRRAELVSVVARHALPTIYSDREYVEAGGLMSYGASVADAHRQAGVYAGRILKGEKPAGLPVLQPTTFELVINLKAAEALGLQVPANLLALADEVIE